jgi:16S rRNA processing protein RimM
VSDADFVLIGLLRRAHGLGGEICVEPVSDLIERFDGLERALISQGDEIKEVGIESVRWKGNLALIKFEGIGDRTAARALSGAMLGVRRQDVFPVPEGTFYVFELIGCEVRNREGRRVGVVNDVLKMPANDVYVLDTGTGEALIPAISDVVKEVDLEKRIIIIEEIEGLLGQ